MYVFYRYPLLYLLSYRNPFFQHTVQVHPSLCCISVQAKNDDAAGNQTGAKQKAYIALALNIAAVLFHVAAAIAIIVPVAVTVSAAVRAAIPLGLHQYYCTYCSYLILTPCTYSYGYSSYSYSTSYSTAYSSYYCTY